MAVKFPLFAVFSAVDEFTAPVGKMATSLYKWGESAKRAGKQLSIGLTAPIVALGAKAAVTGLDYQRSINAITARTGASARAMGELSALAEDALGRTGIPATAREAASGMLELAQSQLKVEEIATAMPGVLRLSAAAQVEVGAAAKLTADELDAYNLKASESNRITDVLAFAAVRGQQGFEGMADGIETLGAKGAALGQRLETNVAVMDALANKGFEASAGALAVVGALTSLARPGTTATRVLTRLTIPPGAIKDSKGQLRDLVDILTLVDSKGATASDMVAIFGKRAGPALASLLGGGVKGAREFRDALDAAGGKAGEIAQVQLANGVGELKQFNVQWERFLIVVARSGLLESLGTLAMKAADVLGWVAKLSPTTLRWGVAIAGVAAAVGPLLLGVGQLVQTMVLLWPAITAVGSALGAVSLTVIGPVVAAFVAVGAAIAAVYVYWDILKTKTKDAWNSVKSTVGGAVDWVGRKLSGLKDYVPDWLLGLVGADAAPAASGARAGSPARRAQLGSGRVERALQRSAGGAGGGASVSGRVQVDFQNLPRGARVKAEQQGDIPIDVDAGYTLAGGLSS